MALHPLIEVLMVLGLVVVVVVLPVAFVVLRVRWLTRLGGSFECSLLLRAGTPTAGWALGVARYVGEDLEWFRYYAMALRPSLRVPRQAGQVTRVRDPEPLEAVALFAGHRIVELEFAGVTGSETCELAMTSRSVTGLLSWIEAGPPGQIPRGINSPGSAY